MKNPKSFDTKTETSAWSSLRQSVFRSIWIATVVSNIGTWMQSVGVGWLMTSLTPSPLLVALMQTATSLPVFLLGLPAGTFADIFNRRKLLLATETHAFSFQQPGVEPFASHLIAAWPDHQTLTEPPYTELS